MPSEAAMRAAKAIEAHDCQTTQFEWTAAYRLQIAEIIDREMGSKQTENARDRYARLWYGAAEGTSFGYWFSLNWPADRAVAREA